MFDLGKLAETMEALAFETTSDKILQSPCLTKNQAEKLSKDYFSKYGAKSTALNVEFPDLSSYVVFLGGQKNA
jgi:hypothetical protein